MPEPSEQELKTILTTLMKHSYADGTAVAEAKQKISSLSQNTETVFSLIGSLFCSLMSGQRDDSLALSKRIWSLGGKLSPFFELVYADCLLNLGELDKASVLLRERLKNPAENLDYFYLVFVKYALMRGDLFLLSQFGDYPNISEAEPSLFAFASTHALDASAHQYRLILKLVFEMLQNNLCAFEYALYPQEIELIFYTNASEEQNSDWEQLVEEKATALFSETTWLLEDLSVKIEQINNHEAWLED